MVARGNLLHLMGIPTPVLTPARNDYFYCRDEKTVILWQGYVENACFLRGNRKLICARPTKLEKMPKNALQL